MRALSCCSLALTTSWASFNCLFKSLSLLAAAEAFVGLSLLGFRPFRRVVGEEELPVPVPCSRSWWDPPPIGTPNSTPFGLPVVPVPVAVEEIPMRPSFVLSVVLVGVVGGCEDGSSCGCFFFFFFVLLLLMLLLMLLWVVLLLVGLSTN
jgi:hypothetical protein